ncbi:MAG: hypothetical protein R3A13_04945 [Bdellovibrionota bacterium]
MDVKDIKPAKPQRVTSGSPVPGKLKSSKQLTQGQHIRVAAASVEINLSESKPPKKSDQVRDRANTLINAINFAKESTNEIEKIAKSIEGIVQQAVDESLPDSRRSVLEQEAQSLVDEIATKAEGINSGARIESSSEGEIRLEIEEKIGKALDTIFPDVAKDSFGIGKINFSQKETIVNVRTNIALARERIDALKNAVEDVTGDLSGAIDEIDIAAQNQEASRASVRKLDQALDLATSTVGSVFKDPAAALNSIKISSENVADLLKE